uniref:Uncharacterized protein n=1 Tax=Chromera velia CCMP2878 TaxID=1169474 RepID=A0A0G4I921_9ALVE|eukprot:Cvel_12100.t1-p1 / transcript=Cvel_12100.t1 / gene=Cvel_12100 / organism=Chromera_velia_CCMP2878 / gene_product=hypothetical protein / transcript_product=hypothetical protein / location=Cvel_scaffold779:57139-58131(+) / protein_length=331 / sequence_SO=supercontig / SO=protein_coding / is_pseudo=false
MKPVPMPQQQQQQQEAVRDDVTDSNMSIPPIAPQRPLRTSSIRSSRGAAAVQKPSNQSDDVSRYPTAESYTVVRPSSLSKSVHHKPRPQVIRGVSVEGGQEIAPHTAAQEREREEDCSGMGRTDPSPVPYPGAHSPACHFPSSSLAHSHTQSHDHNHCRETRRIYPRSALPAHRRSFLTGGGGGEEMQNRGGATLSRFPKGDTGNESRGSGGNLQVSGAQLVQQVERRASAPEKFQENGMQVQAQSHHPTRSHGSSAHRTSSLPSAHPLAAEAAISAASARKQSACIGTDEPPRKLSMGIGTEPPPRKQSMGVDAPEYYTKSMGTDPIEQR